MKRELVIALGLASVLALAACKKKEETPAVEPTAPTAETTAPVESVPADAAAPAEVPKCPTEADPNAACPEATPAPSEAPKQ